GVPLYAARCIRCVRKLWAAQIGWCRKTIPTRRSPIRIGFLPARRGGDYSVLERRAEFVTNTIEWRDHVAGVAPGFRQNGIDRFLIEIALDTPGQCTFPSGRGA